MVRRSYGTDTVSGHVFLREGKRGASWYVKYRIGERQMKKRLGPAWQERGRPQEGYFTRKTAEAALQEILTDARCGQGITEPGSVGVTFADASAEWLRYSAHERMVKRSTLIDFQATARTFDANLGDIPLVEITTEQLERWLEALEEVIDPELGLDFVSRGLVYDIEIEDGEAYITFTLTTPACPIGPQVSEQMREFVGQLQGIEKVHPKMVFDPPWSPEMMSEDAKFALGY